MQNVTFLFWLYSRLCHAYVEKIPGSPRVYNSCSGEPGSEARFQNTWEVIVLKWISHVRSLHDIVWAGTDIITSNSRFPFQILVALQTKLCIANGFHGARGYSRRYSRYIIASLSVKAKVNFFLLQGWMYGVTHLNERRVTRKKILNICCVKIYMHMCTPHCHCIRNTILSI